MLGKNKFTLVFEKEPANYISRVYEKNSILSDFNSNNPISTIYIITGIRGSGKTVLLSSIVNTLKKK